MIVVSKPTERAKGRKALLHEDTAFGSSPNTIEFDRSKGEKEQATKVYASNTVRIRDQGLSRQETYQETLYVT